MENIAIDNSGLVDICRKCCGSDFAPGATYAYDANAKTITITDTSTLPDDEDIDTLRVTITDSVGGQVHDATINATGGTSVIDVSSLDPVAGFVIQLTIVSDSRLVADGSIYAVGSTAPASGTIRYWNKATC